MLEMKPFMKFMTTFDHGKGLIHYIRSIKKLKPAKPVLLLANHQ